MPDRKSYPEACQHLVPKNRMTASRGSVSFVRASQAEAYDRLFLKRNPCFLIAMDENDAETGELENS